MNTLIPAAVTPPSNVRPYRKLSQNADLVRGLLKRLSNEDEIPMAVFLYADKDGCTYPVYFRLKQFLAEEKENQWI